MVTAKEKEKEIPKKAMGKNTAKKTVSSQKRFNELL